MRSPFFSIALLFAVGPFAGCSGVSQSPSSLPAAAPIAPLNAIPAPTEATEVLTFPLPGGVAQMPVLNGIDETLTFGSGIPDGTQLTITMSYDLKRWPPTIPPTKPFTGAAVFYVQFIPDKPVDLSATPGIVATLPSSYSTAGHTYAVAVWNPLAKQWITLYAPAAANGQTITLLSSPVPLQFPANAVVNTVMYQAS